MIERFGPVLQTGIIGALSPFDTPGANVAILDLVTGPAASGSPVFRQETGEILGILIAGQMKRRAALSVTRMIFKDVGIYARFAAGFEAKTGSLPNRAVN
jgi:hypothetical protein